MKHSEILQRKIMTAGDMAKEIFRWKFKSKTVAFTNGCFDILHLGHIDYLAKAADEADYLIVGVNTDESVRRLKGPHRPINGQEQRSRLLAALHCVAGVVLFEEDTPLALIQTLNPDILIKGADYTPDTIVGADFVLSQGGKVQTIEFLEGYSTTSMIQRIRQD